jgi:hypothetical protein
MACACRLPCFLHRLLGRNHASSTRRLGLALPTVCSIFVAFAGLLFDFPALLSQLLVALLRAGTEKAGTNTFIHSSGPRTRNDPRGATTTSTHEGDSVYHEQGHRSPPAIMRVGCEAAPPSTRRWRGLTPPPPPRAQYGPNTDVQPPTQHHQRHKPPAPGPRIVGPLVVAVALRLASVRELALGAMLLVWEAALARADGHAVAKRITEALARIRNIRTWGKVSAKAPTIPPILWLARRFTIYIVAAPGCAVGLWHLICHFRPIRDACFDGVLAAAQGNTCPRTMVVAGTARLQSTGQQGACSSSSKSDDRNVGVVIIRREKVAVVIIGNMSSVCASSAAAPPLYAYPRAEGQI